MALYPVEILPKDYYVPKMSFDSVRRPLGTFFVCRRIDRPVEDYVVKLWGGVRKLDIDCFEDHIVHLSLNLLGRYFKEAYLCFRQKGEGNKPWRGGDVEMKNFEQDYSELSNAYPLYYSSSSLHRRRIPQKLQFGHNIVLPEI